MCHQLHYKHKTSTGNIPEESVSHQKLVVKAERGETLARFIDWISAVIELGHTLQVWEWGRKTR